MRRFLIGLGGLAGIILGVAAFTATPGSAGHSTDWVTYTLADPPADASSPAAGVDAAGVIGIDDRTKTFDSTVPPFRNATFLIINFGQGFNVACSGTMIAPNAVITAAHCLFDPDRALPAGSVAVRPAQDGTVLPYGVAFATTFSVSPGFVPGSLPGTPDDFALVHLNGDPFAGKLGPFVPLKAVSNSDLTAVDSQLWSIGYPADKALGSLWQAKGKTVGFTPNLIFTDMDVFGGQSGSPAYLLDKSGKYRQVGIVSFGSSFSNGIVRITDDHIEQMASWCEDNSCALPEGDAASLTAVPTPTRTKTATPTATGSPTQPGASPTPTATPPTGTKKYRIFAGGLAITR